MGVVGHILTAQEILARLLTVDGAGSGLDADQVDALDSTVLLGSIAGRSAKTATYTVVAGDRGYVIECTSGTFTVNITAAATLGAGFEFTIVNSGSGIITLDPNSSETIRTPSGSATTAVLAQGQAFTVLCDGTGFNCIAVAVPPGAAGRLAKTTTYTVVGADRGMVIDCTSGTFTVSLTAAATLGAGFSVWIYNSGSGTITLDPNGSETIRDPSGSATTKTLTQGQGYLLLCDASGFLAITTAASSGSSTVGTLGALDTASPVAVTGTVTITSSGKNKTHLCTGTSANYTATINTSSGWTAGDVIAFEMGAGLTKLVTLSASALIDGISDRIMWATESCVLRWNGSTFTKIAGKSVPMCGKILKDGSVSQTINDDTVTQVTISDDVKYYGPNNLPAGILVSASSKITVPRPGTYRFSADVNLQAGSNNLAYGGIWVRISGGAYIAASELSANSTTVYLRFQASGLYYFSSGGSDIIVEIKQKSSQARAVYQANIANSATAELAMQEIPTW